MAAGANSPGTLNSFFQFIFRIWNLDFAAGDYSPGTFRLITLTAFAFTLFAVVQVLLSLKIPSF